jgi:hypothetical protein
MNTDTRTVQHMDAVDPTKPNSPRFETLAPDAHSDSGSQQAPNTCYWNGQPVAVGGRVCSQHTMWQCLYGPQGVAWYNVGSC